jgi:hypothetical protein
MLKPQEIEPFLKAVCVHSETLDGKPAVAPPKFIEGMNLLRFICRAREHEEQQQQREGYQAFQEHRQRFSNTLAELIRLDADAQRHGRMLHAAEGELTAREANAVYLLFNFGSESQQHSFLQGSADYQDAMIAAILSDGGLYDEKDFWVELPL